jgi:hypothetical protein
MEWLTGYEFKTVRQYLLQWLYSYQNQNAE